MNSDTTAFVIVGLIILALCILACAFYFQAFRIRREYENRHKRYKQPDLILPKSKSPMLGTPGKGKNV